jgi:hypothetical protein
MKNMAGNRTGRTNRRIDLSQEQARTHVSRNAGPNVLARLKTELNAEREYERVWGRRSWRDGVADVNPAAAEICGDYRVDADHQ